MGLSLDMWRSLAKGGMGWRTSRPPHADWASSLWEEADAQARAAELELHNGWMAFYSMEARRPLPLMSAGGLCCKPQLSYGSRTRWPHEGRVSSSRLRWER